MPKDEKTERVQVVLPVTAIAELKAIAKTKGFAGVSALVRFVTLEYLEKK